MEKNAILLPLGESSHVGIYSKVKLGSEYVIDFVTGSASTTGIHWNLIEIERPDKKLFNSKGDPSKELVHAIRQVQDWHSWVRNNIMFARSCILPQLSSIHSSIIIGRRHSLNNRDKSRLRQMNEESALYEIMTFDRLLDKMLVLSQNFELKDDANLEAMTFNDLMEQAQELVMSVYPISLFDSRGCTFRQSSRIGDREQTFCVFNEDNVCKFSQGHASSCPMYPDELKKEFDIFNDNDLRWRLMVAGMMEKSMNVDLTYDEILYRYGNRKDNLREVKK